MKKPILLIIPAVLSTAALAQQKPKAAKPAPAKPAKATKPVQPAEPQPAKAPALQSQEVKEKKPAVQYSTVPFDTTSTKVPVGYNGHNVGVLFKALSGKLAPKDEFETTDAYQKRLDGAVSEPLFGQVNAQSTFAVALPLRSEGEYPDVKYDADQQVLHVDMSMGDVPYELQDDKAEPDDKYSQKVIHTGNDTSRVIRTYTAENAYRAKREVVEKENVSYDLVFQNVKLFDFKKDQYDEIGWHKNIQFDVPMPVDVARQAKPYLKLLVTFKVNRPYVGKSKEYFGPKVDFPFEITSYNNFVFAQLSQIWLFNSATGEVHSKLTAQ